MEDVAGDGGVEGVILVGQGRDVCLFDEDVAARGEFRARPTEHPLGVVGRDQALAHAGNGDADAPGSARAFEDLVAGAEERRDRRARHVVDLTVERVLEKVIERGDAIP